MKCHLVFRFSVAFLDAKLSEKIDTLVHQICKKSICWHFHTAANTIST